MSNPSRGQRASQPASGYVRPEPVDPNGLVVTVTTRDAVVSKYPFDDLQPHTDLLRSLVQGFARASGPGGRWVSTESMRTGSSNLRAFYRHLQGLPEPISTIHGLTPEVWTGWRRSIEEKYAWHGVVSN